MPLYEYGCNECGIDFEREQRIANHRYAVCPHCGERAKQIIKTAPRTDVYGAEQYCDVQDLTYTSRREYERKMKAGGWEPCGDKVGGARSEYGLKGTLFSFNGQTSRSAPAEGKQ